MKQDEQIHEVPDHRIQGFWEEVKGIEHFFISGQVRLCNNRVIRCTSFFLFINLFFLFCLLILWSYLKYLLYALVPGAIGIYINHLPKALNADFGESHQFPNLVHSNLCIDFICPGLLLLKPDIIGRSKQGNQVATQLKVISTYCCGLEVLH